MEVRERVHGVSYGKFSALARKKEWSAEYLAEVFRGKLEVRGETYEAYFDRILRCMPSGEVVIRSGRSSRCTWWWP